MKRPLFLSATLFALPLISQENSASSDGSSEYFPACSVCECDPSPCLGKMSLRNRSPGGIGYVHGYSSIDLFYAAQTGPNWFPYIDLRGHVFNDGKPAFNAGIGTRYLCTDSEAALGLNFFWDYGNARHTTFHQIGLGAEILWPYWDLHLNGYVPISKVKKSYRTGLHKFKGHSAIIYKKYETAMSGVDLTIGKTIVDCNCFDLRALLTGYYFRGELDTHAGGVQLRLRSNITDWITVEGSASYDSLFKWIGQGELSLNFPFGGPICRDDRKTCCCPEYIALEEQLVRKTERFEIIATTTKKRKTRARDAETGEFLHFLFVNNTSGSNGTFKDPFATLADAAAASKPGDVIYIFPGDGTSTGLDTAITLQDHQSLVGSGAPFFVKGRHLGLIEIPRQTLNRPLLSPAAGGIFIRVTTNNLVSGLHIQGEGVGLHTLIFSAAGSENIRILSNVLISDDRNIDIAPAGRVDIIDNFIFNAGQFTTPLNIFYTGSIESSLTISFNTIISNLANTSTVVRILMNSTNSKPLKSHGRAS